MSDNQDMIDEYLEHLRRAGKQDSTLDSRRDLLTRLDREMEYGIGQVTEDELKAWLYRDEWSQNTKFAYYSGLKDFYGWAADPRDPWITANPMVNLEPVSAVKGVARPCTDEQLRIILTRAREPYRTWATIAAYQGLRCIEISRLDREHVTEKQLFVVKGKGGKPRVHDTDEAVWAILKDRPAGPIARHQQRGDRVSAQYVSSMASTYFRRQLGVPVSMHQLRHWLGVNAQARYKDIAVTKAMLGHSSLTSTQIYVDASDEQQRAARATLPRFAE
ncbi:tyrosine-type recombinase/integrase [Paractinoplanes atraurantiacus]|uniref:Integrase/recombinase XerC n=1 Tax=Paractinoplanes atraurantiacus TaxID=1036182 RepID=A0A285H0U0_9ACTN|nr:tyrosine-type recombinase/integrase [Actinoplanes atraurantiacus]SNY29184.1 integrase/recombinase XerC [Actinoplanes atraurantiacus]